METFQPVDRKNFLNDYGLKMMILFYLAYQDLSKEKVITLSIESLKDLTKKYPNIKYLIAGTGDKNYEQELREYVEKLNLKKNIYFLGYVNEQTKKLFIICVIYI